MGDLQLESSRQYHEFVFGMNCNQSAVSSMAVVGGVVPGLQSIAQFPLCTEPIAIGSALVQIDPGQRRVVDSGQFGTVAIRDVRCLWD